MPVHLPPRLEAQIDQLVADGHFASAESVIVEALRLLQERESRRAQLRAKIQVGLDQLDRGEGVAVTPALWEEIDREAEAALRRGEQPDPDVCP